MNQVILRIAFLALPLTTINCGQGAPSEDSLPQNPVPAQSGASVSGRAYVHTLAVSGFRLGLGPKTVREGGWDKMVGNEGVFATDIRNGFVLAVPNADAPSLLAPALTSNASIHSERVLAYFRAAGTPDDEIGGTHVTTTMRGTAPMGKVLMPAESTFVSYTTHLERVIAGIPVVESQAWASFNARNEVMSEGVYWPAISSSVIRGAIALRNTLSDPAKHAQLRDLVRRSVPDLGDVEGKVVITHTPATYAEPMAAIPSYDVILPGEGSYVRHFDESGREVFLPNEIGEAPPSDPKQ